MAERFEFRFAICDDVIWLAEMNQELIRDEGHRNKMGLEELKERMADFLKTGYNAVIVSQACEDVAYALYKQEPEWMYLRQIFVKKHVRRRGIGRMLIEWLKDGPWKGCEIIRTDVLVNNKSGIKFWEKMGFENYCITMEMGNK
jgi:GNAT superfamily N-acetyltransferase